MKIRFFAILKEYFGEERILEKDFPLSTEELLQYLQKSEPDAAVLLRKCRFAVNNSFISAEFCFSPDDEVLVMPPSSGG